LSLLTGAAASYFICVGNITATIICMSWFWIFDAMDGCFARMYNQTSVLGMYLDPIKDFVVTFLVVFVIYWRYKHMMSFGCWALLGCLYLVVAVLQPIYFTCQQCIKQENNEEVSEFYKPLFWLCGNDPQRKIDALKYATGATNIIILLIIFIVLEMKKRQQ